MMNAFDERPVDLGNPSIYETLGNLQREIAKLQEYIDYLKHIQSFFDFFHDDWYAERIQWARAECKELEVRYSKLTAELAANNERVEQR